jgi:hypothetical protein
MNVLMGLHALVVLYVIFLKKKKQIGFEKNRAGV